MRLEMPTHAFRPGPPIAPATPIAGPNGGQNLDGPAAQLARKITKTAIPINSMGRWAMFGDTRGSSVNHVGAK
jgi:hypothetical protein